MRHECEVDPENQTIILPASFLNTLGLGEHSFDAWFSEPESGSARATFRIVEESEEGENDPALPIPNTGVFTGEGSSAVMVDGIALVAITIGIIAAAWLLTKQAERE